MLKWRHDKLIDPKYEGYTAMTQAAKPANGDWNLTHYEDRVHLTQVFSGGACNVLDGEGNLLRSTERDTINDWLTSRGVYFFDPQIHPDTHGVEYDYMVHYPLEMKARQAATINLYEVSPYTFGGITSFEIATDHFRQKEPMVIYFSDGDPEQDSLPAYSDAGHPLFTPKAIHTNQKAMLAHYNEFRKNGNNMRRYLMAYAREMPTLTVTITDSPADGDIVITPHRMHAVDLFRAVVDAASNKRVFVSFTGGRNILDEKGNPRFMLPEQPYEVETHSLLDQYVDEGNALRKEIARLVNISVFTRVVYTQATTTMALEELLRIKGMLA